jgi:hypothetical protein
MKTLFNRTRNFATRNRGAVLGKALRETIARGWIATRAWRFVSPFMPDRQPQRWVFMCGCYNSGTTILREILGAHPEVASLPREGVRLTGAFPNLEAGGWQRMWFRNATLSDLAGQDPIGLSRRARKDWAPWWRPGAAVFLEKSIVHGSWMPFLEKGFGDCRFVGLVRNGFCASEGIRRRARPSGAAAAELGRDHYEMRDVGQQWVFANARLARDRHNVQHYMEIRYEEFAADPVSVLTRLFRFIGVDETAFHQTESGAIEINGRRFTIRNDNPASLARLTEADRADFLSVAAPMMQELGYDIGGQA